MECADSYLIPIAKCAALLRDLKLFQFGLLLRTFGRVLEEMWRKCAGIINQHANKNINKKIIKIVGLNL